MISDLDICRAAQFLLKTHGEEGPLVAAMRADQLLAEGDIDGHEVWKRIVGALKKLATGQDPRSAPHRDSRGSYGAE